MVRGKAKQDAQEKNARLNAGNKKGSQIGKADAAMVFKCPTCLQVMPNVKLYHAHFTSKHPSETFPAEAQAALDEHNSKKADSAGAAESTVPKKKAPKKKDDLDSLLSEGLSTKPKKK